jgi:hypothetical protein
LEDAADPRDFFASPVNLDWVSGEEVNYQYDELGRLIAAATAGPQWGLSWTYDGFGNRLSQNVTKGSGPVVSLTVNAATNRISTFGFSYDAAGNLVQWPGGTVAIGAEYDVDGRITRIGYDWGGGARHYYNARNQRVRTETRLQVYGLGGELLGEYERVQGQWAPGMVRERIYFAGVWVGTVEENGGVSLPNTDRLGSLKHGSRRYPFGDGNESYANDEYATYRRDMRRPTITPGTAGIRPPGAVSLRRTRT